MGGPMWVPVVAEGLSGTAEGTLMDKVAQQLIPTPCFPLPRQVPTPSTCPTPGGWRSPSKPEQNLLLKLELADPLLLLADPSL